MKQSTRAMVLVLLTTTALPQVTAQVSFTRIREGDIASDAGFGVGCAWGDYDNDGFVDLLVANALGGTNRLYHNNGNGSFTRVTTGKIVNEHADSDCPVWGDYDNDGDLDLFVTNFDPPRDFFYRNEGYGTFTKITQGGWVTDSGAGVGAAWADYDNDGYLDLFVANSQDQNNFLFRNNGDETMSRMVNRVTTSGGMSHGCTWADYDQDGNLDLFVASGAGQNEQQFRNDGNGTFTRMTTGVLVTSGGDDSGISSADFDNDGDLDLFTTGYRDTGNRLFRNDGTNGFSRVTEGALINDRGASQNSAWGDYDNDGYLDLFIANSCERNAMKGENNFLFHNEGDGTFSRVTEGAVVNDGGRSWGCAWADYDNDGDLDLFVANGLYSTGSPSPEPGFLYRNNGGTNHWLRLRLVGTVSNRSAIGAKVRVLATIQGHAFWQLREISGGGGYCSQNDLRAHFGLGNASIAQTIRIAWPSGIVQELRDVPANQTLTMTEPARLEISGVGRFRIRSWQGMVFQIESSTNLLEWHSTAAVTNLNRQIEFTDPDASQHDARFYRVVSVP